MVVENGMDVSRWTRLNWTTSALDVCYVFLVDTTNLMLPPLTFSCRKRTYSNSTFSKPFVDTY